MYQSIICTEYAVSQCFCRISFIHPYPCITPCYPPIHLHAYSLFSHLTLGLTFFLLLSSCSQTHPLNHFFHFIPFPMSLHLKTPSLPFLTSFFSFSHPLASSFLTWYSFTPPPDLKNQFHLFVFFILLLLCTHVSPPYI